MILGGDRDVRRILLEAHHLGITKTNEFVFLYPELMQHEAIGNNSWAGGGSKVGFKTLMELKEAYRSVLVFSLNQPFSSRYLAFSDDVKRRALKDYNFVYDEKKVLLICRLGSRGPRGSCPPSSDNQLRA